MTSKLPAKIEKFPVALVYDTAQNVLNKLAGIPLAYDDNDILTLYGLTQEQLDSVRNDKEFNLEVVLATQELKESGNDIRSKMRQQFSHYLDEVVPDMMTDETVAPKDKISLLQMLGKGSGMLEESTKSKEAQNAEVSKANTPVFNLILQSSTPIANPQDLRIINDN